MTTISDLNADISGFEEVAPGDVPGAPFTLIDGLVPPERNKPRNTKLRKQLEDTYVMMGLAIFPFDNFIGTLVTENADNCATAWDELAATNPRIKKTLERLMETSAYGAVIAAHMPIAVAVATKYIPQLRTTFEESVRRAQEQAAE